MYSFAGSRRWLWPLAVFATILAFQWIAAEQSRAAGEFSVTPTTWDVIGLKSNNSGIDAGPERFPVGAKVCNTTGSTLTNVQAQLVWDSSNSYISVDGPDTIPLGDLEAGKCVDAYYVAQVEKTSSAWNTSREYHIQISADGGAGGSSPTPRQLYVEKLNAQNRNVVYAISGPGGCNADYTVCDPPPTDLEAGKEYTYKVYAETAASYEQLNAFMSFPGSLFQVLGIQSEYAIPSGASVDGPYADACGWDPVPTSATYKSCTGPIPSMFQPDDKVGGKMVVTYRVRATGVGDGSLRGLIYDYSGKSYHYNQDYPDVPINITVKYPLDVVIVGQGNVKTDVGGIDCGLGSDQCHQIYKKDTLVTLTATPGPGQDFIGWSGDGCSGTSLTCQVTMDQARKVIATFSDKQPGTITVKKATDPSADPGLFDLKIDDAVKASGVGNGGTTGAQTLLEGQHTISETANSASPTTLADYNSSLECKDGDQTVPSVDGKVKLEAKQNIVCIFTNTRKAGTLTVKKSLDPTSDPGLFDLKIDDVVKATGVGNDGTTGEQYATAGQHTVSEAANSSSPTSLGDYNSSLECKDGDQVVPSTDGKVQVGDGQKIVCVFLNTRKTGSLTVKKSLDPTSDPGLFDLKIDGTVKASGVGNDGTTGEQTVNAGEHSVSETTNSTSPTSLSDYNSSLECKDGDQVVSSTDGKVQVGDGQKIVCVFTNTRKAGTLTVKKSLDPSSDPGLFDLKIDDTVKASGVGNDGTTGEQYATAGEHTVSETANSASPTTLADYNSSLECKDGDKIVSSTDGKVQVGDGQKIICIFTNTRKTGKLTINKSLSPTSDPGLFDLLVDGTAKATGVGNGGTTGQLTLPIGEYTLSELANSASPNPLSDYNTKLACETKTDSKSIAPVGEKVTIKEDQELVCTWTNTRKTGTINIYKNISPSNDPGSFDLKIDDKVISYGVGDGGSTGPQTVPTGERTVSEAVNAGAPTTLSDYKASLECKDGDQVVDSTDGKVEVAENQNIICTFTNVRKAGTITIVKSLSPSSDPGLFDLQLDGMTRSYGAGDGGSTPALYAANGQHTVSEVANSASPTTMADYNSSLECKDGDKVLDSTDGKVQVDDGQKVICTFTNIRKAGKLTVKKSLDPATDPGLFDLKIDDTVKASGVGNDGTTGEQYATAGEHTVSEAANSSSPTTLADYNTSLECKDGDKVIPSTDGKVQVEDGQKVICVFSNVRKTGKLTVKKALDPATDPGLFDLKIDGTVKASGVGNDGTTGEQTVNAGEHTVSEAANSYSPTSLADYNSSLQCKDGDKVVDSTDGKVQVTDGQKIICVFTNVRQAGTLTVTKSLSPTSDPGLFDLKIDGTAKASGVGNNGTTGEQTVNAGERVVSESANSSSPTSLADYNTTLECKDGDKVVPSADGKVQVGDGQKIICLFTNTRKAGTLTVTKSLSPTTDPGLFDLKIDGTTKASGVGNDGTTGEQYALSGEHTVSEAANSASPTSLADYNTTLECKDGDKVVPSADGKVQVGDGQKIVCIFSNLRQTGKLTIKKSLSPTTDPGLFDLKIDGTVKASGVGNDGTTGEQTVNAGEHNVSEDINSASPTKLSDYKASLECKDGDKVIDSTDGKVQVGDGQNIICVFTNTRHNGAIVLNKSLSPAADPGLFDLKIDDVVKASGVGNNGTTGTQEVVPGKHSVAEAANSASPTSLADYNSSLECKDGDKVVPSTDGNIDVSSNQKITCIFTNTRKAGTLTVKKALSPTTDPGLFDLKIDDVVKASGVGNDGTTGAQYAAAGQHTVSEATNSASPTTLADYDTGLACKDGEQNVASTDGKVPVADGQNIICTFTNTRKQAVQFPLTAAVIGSGTVTSNIGGIDCPGVSCNQSYDPDTTVTLTPKAAAGWVFQGWTGDCTNKTGNCVVLMSKARSVVAIFAQVGPAAKFTLRVQILGRGQGRVTATGGVNCLNICRKSYNAGTRVLLRERPKRGYRFIGWSGACKHYGRKNYCRVTMNQFRSVYAIYRKNPRPRFTG